MVALSEALIVFSYRSYPGLGICWLIWPRSVIISNFHFSFAPLDEKLVALEDYRPLLHSAALVISLVCLHSAIPFSCRSAPRETAEMFTSGR